MAQDGTFEQSDGMWTLRFERVLAHPVETVWDAITRSDRLKGWLSDNGTIDLRLGGEVRLDDQGIRSTIVELDPPRVVEYGWKGSDWDGGTVRWELTPSGGGTRLVLTHRLKSMTGAEAEQFKASHEDLPPGWEPRSSTLAGWHTILDRLTAALDGAAAAWDQPRWAELNEHYRNALAL